MAGWGVLGVEVHGSWGLPRSETSGFGSYSSILIIVRNNPARSGSIVIVSSVAGYRPFPSLGPYNVSKTALLGLMQNLAIELAPHNIRVNCLAPGLIRTNFSSVIWKNEDIGHQMLQDLSARRIGVPSDCSGIVSFLCSSDADYITGQTVVVSGGVTPRL